MLFSIGLAYPGPVIFLAASVGYGLLLHYLQSIVENRPDIVDEENRVHDIEPEKLRTVYDYIIVGGGSAGSVLANRLSEMPWCKILLIEAGLDEPLQNEAPLFWTTLMNTEVDWQFKAEPSTTTCLGQPNSSCPWPRGKTLGGTSSINAMLYVRGNRFDYDRWRDLGNDGWGYEDVLPYFKKSEDMRIPKFRDSPYHGTGGYYTVEYNDHTSQLIQSYFDAANELGLSHPNGDYNGEIQLGMSQAQSTIRDGRRCSNNKAFIRSASKRKNLHIILKSQVTKVLLNGKREAIGVRFTRDGREYEVRSRKEVILSAGAIQSPQLLMLSGIGPASKLERHDIRCLVDLPGVGENLQDHVALAGVLVLIHGADPPLSYVTVNLLNPENSDLFIRNSSGPYCGSLVDTMLWMNSELHTTSLEWPDLQLFFVSTTNINLNALISKEGLPADGFLIYPTLMRPDSRGNIELRSKNPFEHPIINANYFQEPKDFEVLTSIVDFMNEFLATTAMRKLGAALLPVPGCETIDTSTKAFFECLARVYTQSIWHPVGTCKMGPKSDPMAVVDSELRVHGVKNLRVIDASIMPFITTGNTNTPTTMIAEKGADLIKRDCLVCLKVV